MHKGIVVCSICGDAEFYEGQCANDITAQTNYYQLDDLSWLCPECSEAWDISLKEAFNIILELAQGNMIGLMDANKDPVLLREHFTQEKAYDMVSSQRKILECLDK